MSRPQNQQCEKHKKVCEYLCTYSKCSKRLLCGKCRREHLQIHPQQFLFQLDNLIQIHSFNKINKLKEMLVKDKNIQEMALKGIYDQVEELLHPFVNHVTKFAQESRELIKRQLNDCLRTNKNVIEAGSRKIQKTQTQLIKDNPNIMLQQTMQQADVINKCEVELRENLEHYKEYYDTTKKMCTALVEELRSMMSVSSKLVETSIKSQRNRYHSLNMDSDHHESSFYKRYHASHEVAFDKNKLEAQVMQIKRDLQARDKAIGKAQSVIKEKVVKIEELQEKVEGLREELLQWEQKLGREEREKKTDLERQHRKKEEHLIKHGIIGYGGRQICLQKKVIQQQNLPLILQIVPNAIVLDVSSHTLTPQQIQTFLKYSISLQVFKYNFNICDMDYLCKALKTYSNLTTLELNSCSINDQVLTELSRFIPQKLRSLSLIDNMITDQGLEQFCRTHAPLEILYISYNRLTAKSIETIGKYSFDIKKLHIAKNKIASKGAQSIGRFLKDIEELFLGSCSIGKDGFLSICRHCLKLKRLSLVANQLSTETISEILTGLQNLEWLDISYCNLNKFDLEKVQKLKIFNKALTIITSVEVK